MGQYGEIQPIGGVNTKIDGFWEVCRMRYQQGERPEGGYGVLIPTVNVRDLMLRPEVAASIANEGWFHIWPVGDSGRGDPAADGGACRHRASTRGAAAQALPPDGEIALAFAGLQ